MVKIHKIPRGVANTPRPVRRMPHRKGFGEVRLDTDGFAARLRIDPMENTIIGSDNIKRYIGVRSMSTLYRYIEQYGFPAIKRPDGLWMTTMTAIDQWIFLAAETANDNQRRSRGLNVKAEIALDRLQRQVADGRFDHKMQNAVLRVGHSTGLRGMVAPPRSRVHPDLQR